MTIERLLEIYQSGALTASGVAAQTWKLVSDSNVDTVLRALPPEVIHELKQFVSSIRSGAKMIRFDGGGIPTNHQLELVDEWIKANEEQ
ncbi:MAG TPA: hypothetical protein VG269_29435 [Tepidisphaeraceae bacterium]|jgi:hypothetical protein|nr:hypothetical protein [Tepidisphaeraceae bacterium]